MNEELLENTTYFSIISKNVVPTAIGVLFIIGALLVSFSKEKLEDEFIAEIRQSSLLWAVLVNYILLLLAFVFIYGLAFMNVMIYNMFTILIIFIIRFNYILYKSSKEMPNEKYNQSATSY
jgi:ABC-type Fe3+-siderophore transport system permease subunit